MSDNPDQPKMLPSPEEKKPEEKKRPVLNLSIDVEELYSSASDFTVPANQDTWHDKKEMSPEYLKLNQVVQILSVYIARRCNEGPEVKDNIAKRLVLIRTVLGILLDNFNITGYDAYGLLMELLNDTYMKVSGQRHIYEVLMEIGSQQRKMATEASKQYSG